MIISGLDFGDLLGTSIDTCGDFNSDGIADIIIGAPGYGLGGVSYIIFGQSVSQE